jgi:hypothetical protein
MTMVAITVCMIPAADTVVIGAAGMWVTITTADMTVIQAVMADGAEMAAIAVATAEGEMEAVANEENVTRTLDAIAGDY